MLFHVQARWRGDPGLTLVGVVLITPLCDGRVVAAFLRSGRVESVDAWLVRDGLDIVCGLAGSLGDSVELVIQSTPIDDSGLCPSLAGCIEAPAYNGWRVWFSRAWSRRRAVLQSDRGAGGRLG